MSPDDAKKTQDEKDKKQPPSKRDDYGKGDATKSDRLPGDSTTPAPPPSKKEKDDKKD